MKLAQGKHRRKEIIARAVAVRRMKRTCWIPGWCIRKDGADGFEARILPEALQKKSVSINAAAQSIFPDIMLIDGINLTETSQIAISSYPDKEAADKALAERDAHHETQDIELVMSHAGNISFF